MSNELSDDPELTETLAPTETPAPADMPANRSWSVFDFILLGLLLTLAFLLGAFRATNNDLYLHLAVGKFLSHGAYTFGVDPFSWTTEGQYWVNHSWLYDWSVYGWFQSFGGPALVALHASFVVALTLLLWFARPKDASWLMTAEVLGLGVLVASARYGVHPTTLSFVFWAGLIAILFRAGVLGDRPEPLVKRLWMLPALFALWANFDVGFMFGLLLLGLTLTVPSPNRKLLGRVTLACVLACCLNPHHVRVFTLPPELSYIVVGMQLDFLPSSWIDAGRTMHGLNAPSHYLLHSPLSSTYLNSSGASCAGLFYFLVLLGYISSQAAVIVLARRTRQPLPWTNVVVGSVFALLSLILARMIPWFALLAGPLFLSNLSLLSRLRPMPAPLRPWLLKVAATLLLALGILLAIPGWLHSNRWDAYSSRRVALSVYENSSLRRLAERLTAEKAGRVLALNRDLPAYLAYFGSGIKTYMDTRFELFAQRTTAFREIRQSLLDDAKKPSEHPYWEEEMQQEKIDVIAFTEGFSSGEAAPLLKRFWSRSADWPMLFGDGTAQAFGRRRDDWPRGPSILDLWARRAFGPQSTIFDIAPAENRAARSLGDVYWQRIPPMQETTTEPLLLNDYYVQYRDSHLKALAISQEGQLIGGGALGLTAGPIAALNQYLAVATGQGFENPFQLPALPVLAIQEGRRLAAIAPFPFPVKQGPEPNLLLAQNLHLLARDVEDRWLELRPGPFFGTNLQEWRRIQIASAADRARFEALAAYVPATAENIYQILEPSEIYRRMMQERGFVDADYHLLESVYSQATQILQNSAQKPEKLERRIGEMKAALGVKETNFKAVVESYDLLAADFAAETPFNYFEKYHRAKSVGLGMRALENLRKIDLTPELLKKQPLFCGDVVLATMHQYLRFGNAHEAVKLTEENREAAVIASKMAPIYFLQLHVFALTCSGNYKAAEQELKLTEEKGIPPKEQLHLSRRFVASQYVLFGQLDLANTLFSGGLPLNAVRQFNLVGATVQDVNVLPEIRMFRGLIALEQGKTREALSHFETALDYDWPDNYFPERGIIRHYRDLLKKQFRK